MVYADWLRAAARAKVADAEAGEALADRVGETGGGQ